MDKEQMAIGRLRQASEMSLLYYKKPLVVTTSGGKDSSVCVELALRAGIPFEVMHSHTTADAPETVRFVRSEFKRLEEKGIKCILNMPTYKGEPTSMWKLIPQKLMPPTRAVRYCCSVLKETGGKNRFITTGVRWAESAKRKNNRGIYETMPGNIKKKIILSNDNDDTRRLFEACTLSAKRICNPIVDWSDDDVWAFLHESGCPANPLYECGFSRVGCIGCPMAGQHGREVEFRYWPGYKKAYIRAFDRMLAERAKRGKMGGSWRTGSTGIDVFNWWMEYDVIPGQIDLLEEIDEQL